MQAIFTFDYEITEGCTSTEFRAVAEEHGIPCFVTEKVNHEPYVSLLYKLQPDLIVSFFWKRLLSPELLKIPRLGAVNIHYALLPKYRGYAAINWAILNGEEEIGVTLHYMDAQADAGEIIAQEAISILPGETVTTLNEKATDCAVELVRRYLPLLETEKAPRIPQDEEKALYAFARVPSDGIIDWSQSVGRIHALIRAVNKPYPGAYTFFEGKKLFIWQARPLERKIRFLGRPGQIVKIVQGEGVWVLAGDGILVLELVQPEGGEELRADVCIRSIQKRLGFDIQEELYQLRKELRRLEGMLKTCTAQTREEG